MQAIVVPEAMGDGHHHILAWSLTHFKALPKPSTIIDEFMIGISNCRCEGGVRHMSDVCLQSPTKAPRGSR
eukprot:scaffold60733_cov32-Tisochrysis_lutea.AAC.3